MEALPLLLQLAETRKVLEQVKPDSAQARALKNREADIEDAIKERYGDGNAFREAVGVELKERGGLGNKSIADPNALREIIAREPTPARNEVVTAGPPQLNQVIPEAARGIAQNLTDTGRAIYSQPAQQAREFGQGIQRTVSDIPGRVRQGALQTGDNISNLLRPIQGPAPQTQRAPGTVLPGETPFAQPIPDLNPTTVADEVAQIPEIGVVADTSIQRVLDTLPQGNPRPPIAQPERQPSGPTPSQPTPLWRQAVDATQNPGPSGPTPEPPKPLWRAGLDYLREHPAPIAGERSTNNGINGPRALGGQQVPVAPGRIPSPIPPIMRGIEGMENFQEQRRAGFAENPGIGTFFGIPSGGPQPLGPNSVNDPGAVSAAALMRPQTQGGDTQQPIGRNDIPPGVQANPRIPFNFQPSGFPLGNEGAAPQPNVEALLGNGVASSPSGPTPDLLGGLPARTSILPEIEKELPYKDPKWLAMAMGGLTMMGSQRPDFMGAAAEGGMAGLGVYQGEQNRIAAAKEKRTERIDNRAYREETLQQQREAANTDRGYKSLSIDIARAGQNTDRINSTINAWDAQTRRMAAEKNVDYNQRMATVAERQLQLAETVANDLPKEVKAFFTLSERVGADAAAQILGIPTDKKTILSEWAKAEFQLAQFGGPSDPKAIADRLRNMMQAASPYTTIKTPGAAGSNNDPLGLR